MPYVIRRSQRARRVSVNVDPVSGEVEVVLPNRAPERAATSAVKELGPWIEKQQDKALAARQHVIDRRGTVPFLGETLKLVPEADRTRVHRKDDRLLVPGTDPKPALERYYRRMAKVEVVPRLDAAVADLGTLYKSVRIAGQRTRWGSCTSAGVMSFNWRLLLAPERVLDYVIWHEACHLVVLDHSQKFWALVETHVPEHKEASTWLRKNAATLVL